MTVTLRRLIVTEAKLFVREPMAMLFVFAFPALVVVILGGVFAADDPAFGGATPSDYYVAAYACVVLAALGFVMLPVHLAAYRERGVLRRFEASHIPLWALALAWVVVASVLAILALVVMLTVAGLVYGLPAVSHPTATGLAVLVALAAFVNLGILLGLVLPTARAAQGVGLALFFPSFLLGGGGPPPGVMPAPMRAVSNLLPMTHAVRAIQQPWLSLGRPAPIHLALVAAMAAAAAGAWLWRSTRLAVR